MSLQRALAGPLPFGIPSPEQGGAQKLFDKFYRGANTGSSGAGLGLAICRGIVEAHSGSIRVERVIAGGLSIQITILAFTLTVRLANAFVRHDDGVRLLVDDLPVRVLLDDLVAAEFEQVDASDADLLACLRRAGEQPCRHAMISEHPVSVVPVVNVGDA